MPNCVFFHQNSPTDDVTISDEETPLLVKDRRIGSNASDVSVDETCTETRGGQCLKSLDNYITQGREEC